MEVFVKKIVYDFKNHKDFEKVCECAYEHLQEQYTINQKQELADIQSQIDDGFIDSIEEADRKYNLTFDDYAKTKTFNYRRMELINDFMREYLNLPKSALVDVPAVDMSGVSLVGVKRALFDKFGIEADSCEYNKPSLKDIMTAKTDSMVNDMITKDGFSEFIKLKARISNYSIMNTLLVYAQMPDATIVMGAKEWQNHGRKVTAELKDAIAITYCGKKDLKSKTEIKEYADYCAKIYHWDAKHKENYIKKCLDMLDKNKVVQVGKFFGTTYVYDVSQTEVIDKSKDDIKLFVDRLNSLNSSLDDYDNKMLALSKAYGSSAPAFNSSLPESRQVYEQAVAFCDKYLTEKPESINGIKSFEVLDGNFHKLETLVAASAISTHAGVDCSQQASLDIANIISAQKMDISKESFATCMNQKSLFEKSFDRGFKLAKTIIEKYDKALSELEKDKSVTAGKDIAEVKKDDVER